MKIIPCQGSANKNVFGRCPQRDCGRVVIGKTDGAKNLCMRVFELDPGTYTGKHAHEWEHEVFVHSGKGSILRNGKWATFATGSVIFIPGGGELAPKRWERASDVRLRHPDRSSGNVAELRVPRGTRERGNPFFPLSEAGEDEPVIGNKMASPSDGGGAGWG